MNSPAFARCQGIQFDVMLNSTSGEYTRSGNLREYLQTALKDGKSWDKIFQELILPDQKDPKQNGAADYLRNRLKDQDRLTDELIAAFKTVFDPEIPVDIYELGLIYKVDIDDDRKVDIEMTLTAPGCPVAGDMPGWVENAARGVEGVKDVEVSLTFDPPWDPSRMSDEARLALNML